MTLAVGLILLVVVFPIVVILLHGVLKEANAIVPSVAKHPRRGARRVQGPRRGPAAADHAAPGQGNGRERRRLRWLPRRDPG